MSLWKKNEKKKHISSAEAYRQAAEQERRVRDAAGGSFPPIAQPPQQGTPQQGPSRPQPGKAWPVP